MKNQIFFREAILNIRVEFSRYSSSLMNIKKVIVEITEVISDNDTATVIMKGGKKGKNTAKL